MSSRGCLLFLAITLWTGRVAAAEWQVVPFAGDEGDLTVIAVTHNSQGFGLGVYQRNGWRRLLFTAPAYTAAITDVGSISIDAHSHHSFEALRILQKSRPDADALVITEHAIEIRLASDLRESSPTAGELRELMDGARATYRYFITGGAAQEVVFDLAGAKAAIARAIDRSEEPTADEVAYRSSWIDAVRRCPDPMHGFTVCSQLLLRCAGLPDRSNAALKNCLAGKGP